MNNHTENLKLPSSWSIITEHEYDIIWAHSKQPAPPIMIFRCDLSQKNVSVWAPVDIEVAKRHGVWDNGHSQVRICTMASIESGEGLQRIVYVKKNNPNENA